MGDLSAPEVLFSSQHCKDVLQGMESLLKEQVYCDTKLQARDGEALQAHRIILMSCSKFFRSHYSQKVGDDDLHLPDASHCALSALLDFVYSGRLEVSKDSVGNVQDLAEKFEMKEARRLCKQFNTLTKKTETEGSLSLVSEASELAELSLDGQLDCCDDNENDSESLPGRETSETDPMREKLSVPQTSHCLRSSRSSSVVNDSRVAMVADTPEFVQSESLSVSGAKRRKPGRPQKLPNSSPEKQDDDRKENISGRLKRKSMTPKKLADFAVNMDKGGKSCNSVKSKDPPAKRGRGRPRKNTAEIAVLEEGKAVNGKINQLAEGNHNKSIGHMSKPGNSISDIPKELSLDQAKEDKPKRKRGRPSGSKAKKFLSQETEAGENQGMSADSISDIQQVNEARCLGSEDAAIDMPVNRKSSRNRKCCCMRCKMEFESVALLEKHRNQCRKSISFEQPDKYKRKRCGKCQIEFPDFSAYQEHRKTHAAKRSLKATKKPHVCDICEQGFRYESFLACHRYSKHKIPFDESKFKVISCSKCDFATVNKWRYKVHLGLHGDQRPFVCDVCGKSFKANSSLTTHKKSHSQERKFECEECGKRFLQLSGKEQHIRRIHKKEMPFLCHLCPYKCFVKTELLQHLHKDHEIPLPNKYVRYKCELCDFMTFRRFHFINHMNMHEGNRMYECEICHKKYTSKVVLRCHMQFHKEPRHKCPWEGCKYAAVQKRRLTQHIQLIHTHKDVKPFSCHICTYKTALNGNLKLHLRNVHHLDIPRKQIQKQQVQTLVEKMGTKENDSSISDYVENPQSMMTINRSDIVSLAVASCEDISPIATPQIDEDQSSETLVIYTTDSSLPAQVTAAQVLQQLSSGNPLGDSDSTTAIVASESVTIVTQADSMVHLPDVGTDSELNDKNEKDDIIQVYSNMNEKVTRSIAGAIGDGLTTEIHIPVTSSVSPDARHSDLVSHDLRSRLSAMGQELSQQIYIQPRDLGDGIAQDIRQDLHMMRDVQIQELSEREDMRREIHVTSELGQEPQRDSGLVIQEMMNAQYPSETFLPDSRNLNLVIQSMENREGFPTQQGNYWSQY